MSQEACALFVADCQVRASVDLISHAWDPLVVAVLRAQRLRRRDLLERMEGVSDKVLTDSLRRLTGRGLVERTDDSRPSHAVYGLTELGRSFADGPLAVLATWARDNQAQLA